MLTFQMLTEQIFIPTNVVVKAAGWNDSLYVGFLDFQVFNIVCTLSLWQIVTRP